MNFIPSDIVVPLFGYIKGDEKWIFIGTGFFIGDQALLVTAGHVLGTRFEKIAIQIMKDNKFYYASSAVHEPSIDLAILKIEQYTPPFTCKFYEEATINFAETIYCYEYGTTISKGNEILLSPATRIGNVTRFLNKTETYGKAGDQMLELSFPALKGASGSPVVKIADGLYVQGVVIGNVSYHLFPSQIETILDEENKYIEEVKYLMPQGLAVHSKHLLAFYKKVKNEI